MDNLGKHAMEIVARASQKSPLNVPALPASTTSAPRYFAPWADVESRRLFSAWKPDNAPQAIVRPLTEVERVQLTKRANELRDGVQHGYLPAERDLVEAVIGAMFSGFRSMRQEGSSAEATVSVTASTLREFPVWAIEKACMRIARNEAGLVPRWPPNDAQIHGVVLEIVQEHRKTLANIEALLIAPVEEPRTLPAPAHRTTSYEGPPFGAEPHAPLLPAPKLDGNHASRVAADLAARKMRRGNQVAAE